MTWQPELDELRRRQELAERMGGPEKIRRQRDAGRLIVRERIAVLLTEIRARLDAVRNPMRTAEHFGIEEIIDPRETRPLLCDWVRDAYAVLRGSPPGRPAFGLRP